MWTYTTAPITFDLPTTKQVMLKVGVYKMQEVRCVDTPTDRLHEQREMYRNNSFLAVPLEEWAQLVLRDEATGGEGKYPPGIKHLYPAGVKRRRRKK